MQRHSSSLLWWIVAVLTVILIAVSGFLFFTQHSAPQSSHPQDMPTGNALAPVAFQQAASQPPPESSQFKATPNRVLVEEDLLNQAIPKNLSLAQEEIATQLDIQQQLLEQEKALQQQNLTADELIRLKQQQIDLLEQQLAEIEHINQP